MVEPFGLVEGELRAGFADFLQREKLHHLIKGEDFLFSTRIPAQQGQHIHHGIRQIAAFAISQGDIAALGIAPLQREYRKSETVAVAFAELAVAIGLEQQRQMCELRGLPAERFVQHHVQGRRRQPLLTTDHVRNLHRVVIHNVGQMVSRHSIRLIQHLIIQKVGIYHHLSTNQVVDVDVGVFGIFETDHVRCPRLNSCFRLFCTQCQRVDHRHPCGSIVLEGLLLTFRLLAFGIQVFGRVESIICPTVTHKLLSVWLVHRLTLRLFIRTELAADADALVELESEPLEGLDDVLLCARHEAGLVSILDTQQESAAVFLGKQIVIQCGTHAADVKRSGRTRRKSYSRFHIFHKCLIQKGCKNTKFMGTNHRICDCPHNLRSIY